MVGDGLWETVLAGRRKVGFILHVEEI
jgi:hypothetical protein